jgi:uncharacterized protein YjbI with pentapeptide repeats
MNLSVRQYYSTLNALENTESNKLSDLLDITGFGKSKADAIEFADFSELDLSNEELPEYFFESTDFSLCKFEGTRLNSTTIRNCAFDAAVFQSTDLESAELDDLSLSGISFNDCEFDFALIKSGSLENVRFSQCNLSSATFAGPSLKNVEFLDSKIVNGKMSGISLQMVLFKKCDLSDATLEGSKIGEQTISDDTIIEGMRISTDCGLNNEKLQELEERGAILVPPGRRDPEPDDKTDTVVNFPTPNNDGALSSHQSDAKHGTG